MAEDAAEMADDDDDMKSYRLRRARDYYERLRQNAPMPFGGRIQDHANNMQAAQASHLQGAANNVMSAHANEMQSRVSQQREMRRMQHEKELAKMRMDADIYGAAIRSLLR